MKPEDKQILIRDLCARLPYGVVCNTRDDEIGIVKKAHRLKGINRHNKIWWFEFDGFRCVNCRPYLRQMSSMTEEDARELSILYGLKDILSIKKITDEYIEVVVDDGFCSTETGAIWYNEIISSIEIFDWLNRKMFDYRGLIPMGLALEAPKDMYVHLKT